MSIERLLDKPALRNTRTLAATANSATFFVLASISLSTLATTAFTAVMRRPIHLQAGIAIAMTAAGLLLISAHHRVREQNPTQYTILALEGTLEVRRENGYRRYTYERLQRIEAARNDLRLIELREHWTGKSATDPQVELCKPRGARLLDGKDPETDSRVYRWVYPGRPMRRGEQLEVMVRQTHADDLGVQRPYFRQGGGRYKTKSVTVRVRFPKEEDPGDVTGAAWNTGNALRQTQIMTEFPPRRHDTDDASMVEYSIEVTSPARHHSYGLRWTWPRSEAETK
ncbi:hypothetical protein K1W54_21105 [Micromonospora sp. CPCC 205371]|nr:hypothetical protein [Micromonospora sp. CPCC 205371]